MLLLFFMVVNFLKKNEIVREIVRGMWGGEEMGSCYIEFVSCMEGWVVVSLWKRVKIGVELVLLEVVGCF